MSLYPDPLFMKLISSERSELLGLNKTSQSFSYSHFLSVRFCKLCDFCTSLLHGSIPTVGKCEGKPHSLPFHSHANYLVRK